MRLGRSTASARRTWPRWAGAGAALLLHGLGLALLVPHQAGRPAIALADPPLVEVEMVDQVAETKGRPAPPPPAPTPPPPDKTPPPRQQAEKGEQPPPPQPPPPQPPPPQQAEKGEQPPPSQQQAEKAEPPPPPPAAPPAPKPASWAPAVNLGNGDDDQDPLQVTGTNVVPPNPAAAFHNKPPGYPMEAARRHREGVVLVRALINTAGVPDSVMVARSSGDPALDRAAREAVELWRFTPASSGGVAVPFEYEVNINFKLGD